MLLRGLMAWTGQYTVDLVPVTENPCRGGDRRHRERVLRFEDLLSGR